MQFGSHPYPFRAVLMPSLTFGSVSLLYIKRNDIAATLNLKPDGSQTAHNVENLLDLEVSDLYLYIRSFI